MINKFIEENFQRNVKSFEKDSEIYARYLAFCKYHNVKPITKTMLSIQLKNLNAGVRHRRTRNWVKETGRQGVKLLPCKY